MSDCLFCKIIDGSIPSTKIYEDEYVYAFMDIMPLTKGHTLLIPKEHVKNVYEMSEETAANLFKVAPRIANAIKDSFQPSGMNLLNNCEEAAGQSVFHFHLHFIPRYDETDGFKTTWITKEDEFAPEMLKTLADEVIANLNK
ncbi:HIT family protein [Rummeliibacillus sp. TYF-LIM-RU47]|uniref:HIT family protein n=1 Tax=Rummeliibacillus sp. TYF-LIM-RU47 TaxID=2608406 RepID=UPI00123B82F8|nr:HIT family protein [Rummeliibacillus sp. TYF-LIM-RU47]